MGGYSGTLTFLFTDIEGSTQLWERYPDRMRQTLAQHDVLLRTSITGHRGRVFKTVGDAFCAAFDSASLALAAALEIQRGLIHKIWEEIGALRVRIAIHSGEAEERDGDYFGPALNRVARLLAVTRGGYTIFSSAAREEIGSNFPEESALEDLGLHALRDIPEPQRIFQLVHPDLPSDFPLTAAYSPIQNNLPVPVNRFIGRSRELREIKKFLSESRLVTVTGPGGSGKTRLCLQAARELIGIFPDGVWMVELASLSDPALVAQEVAGAMGVQEEPGSPIQTTLLRYLKSRNVLLALDNCEHLVEACASMVETVLRGSPKLKVLASSRQPLGLSGEGLFRLASLSTPGSDRGATPESLLAYDSVRLFVDRAASASRQFSLTRANAAPVAQICQDLEGIPLALELAATRVKMLSVEQIAARLKERFRLLTGGSRTALPRHQTLQAALDWSHDLLSPDEQALFRRLSVFSGRFSLEAAESAAGFGEILPEAVLDLLAELVDKSLVLSDEREEEAGFRMLETIRDYGLEKLRSSGEEKEARGRHAEFYLKLAEEAEPELTGRNVVSWIGRLEMDHDNLRSALLHYRSRNDVERELRLAGALWKFWYNGHLAEGGRWLEDALSRADGASLEARAKATLGAGTMAWRQNDFPRAVSHCRKSLEMARALGDGATTAYSLVILGSVPNFQGDYPQAKQLFEQGLSLFRESGDRFGTALALLSLSQVFHHQGDCARALELLEEALGLLKSLYHAWGIAFALDIKGQVLRSLGKAEEARALLRESLAIRQDLGDKPGIAEAQAHLGQVAVDLGAHEDAALALRESLAYFQEVGASWYVAAVKEALGRLALATGRIEEAKALFRESFTVRQAVGDRRGMAESLAGLARALVRVEELEHAAALYGAATRIRREVGAPVSKADAGAEEEMRSTLESRLGPEILRSQSAP